MFRPNLVQIGRVPHHAMGDGMGVVDALGTKLLHVLIDLCGQSAKFIHAHSCLPRIDDGDAGRFERRCVA